MNLTHATSYPFCSFRRRVQITPLMRHRMMEPLLHHRVIGRLFEELCFVMCLDLSFTCGCDLCFDLMDCVCEFMTCGCDIWLVVAICCYLSCGCDIMCENGFVVIYMWLLWCLWYICDMWYIFELFVSVECKKQKKIAVSVDLPSAMVMTLGKAGKLCGVPGHCTRQRFFFLKNKKSLPSAKLGRHSAKSFFKKLKNVGTRQRVFEKK